MASPEPLSSPTAMPLLQEKGLATPATRSSLDSPRPRPTSTYVPENRIKGALGSLLWGAFGPCMPVVIVTSVLLTAILYNRIPAEYVFLPNEQIVANEALTTLYGIQQISANGGDKAYYLFFNNENNWTNPAVLHTISSWTAKIIPFVTGALMALVAFFVGQSIINSTKGKSEQLPTPNQVSILIGLLNGGTQPWFQTIMYRWNHHAALVRPVPVAFWCLTFIVCITLAIGAIDSWFGTATTALQISLVIPAVNATQSFGRSLNSHLCAPGTWAVRQCPSNPQAECRYPCSITSWNSSGYQREGVYAAQQAARTLLYNSLTDTISNVTVNNSNYFFLGDINSGSELDFAAETLAVQTQCQVVTQNTTISPTGGFTYGTYTSPSFSYSGEVGVAPENATAAPDDAMVGIQFFTDSALTRPVGYGSNTTDLFAPQNPLHFLTWSKGFPPVDTYADEFGGMRTGGYLKNDINGDAVFVLSCSTTISQAEYYWVNGTVSTDQLKPYEDAPDYYGAVFSAPFAIDSALSHLALQDAAALAAYQTEPEDLTEVFSNYFSRAAVAFSAGISVPVMNDKEWTRDNFYLATRVPYAPLFTLVALQAVYAVFALSLALVAVFLTHPTQVQEVKERLTVDGLATGFFEPVANHQKPVEKVTDLFEEHHSPEKSADTKRIGLLQTEQGGWMWVSVGHNEVEGLGIQRIRT